MRNILVIISVLYCLYGYGQEKNYTNLINKASEEIEKDSLQYKNVLNIYKEAFQKYPDSITRGDLYDASVIALKNKQLNTAFEYITQLSNLTMDNDDFPGWLYILNNYYTPKDYPFLEKNEKWIQLREKAEVNKKRFYEELKTKKKEFFARKEIDFSKIKNPEKLYKTLREYQPYITKNERDYSIQFVINDSATTSYHVHLPKNYNPKKKYPLLFFLHGAVRYNTIRDFYTFFKYNLGYWNRYYTKYAEQNEVILVFPSGGKKYNWMTPDNGFFMIPEMLKQIKSTINVDDNKVFITGHSNGATGSFSYLMKQSTPFAGFYGFNTYPYVFTGGTFIENIKNRSFINFSTDEDYYYPPKANDSLTALMNSIQADYREYRYNGFPHWFPKFDESEPAYVILFNDLKKRERNPFPKKITWEFDDNKYGNMDWLANIKLDTLAISPNKLKHLNFKITEWLSYNEKDSLISEKVDKEAFDFPRKSGKIIAEYDNNVFKIKTYQIQSFEITISPEMVDLNKNIKVYVNGKLKYDQKVKYDKIFMLKNFQKNMDKEQIWVNRIKL
ncbi:hypothetical protein KRX57_09295 [Weeksellaceae bacterium TAE3-ERU29]|nr:hypothetical protein [Weeksellaceae bacterium TAE3-ERU29]